MAYGAPQNAKRWLGFPKCHFPGKRRFWRFSLGLFFLYALPIAANNPGPCQVDELIQICERSTRNYRLL